MVVSVCVCVCKYIIHNIAFLGIDRYGQKSLPKKRTKKEHVFKNSLSSEEQ